MTIEKVVKGSIVFLVIIIASYVASAVCKKEVVERKQQSKLLFQVNSELKDSSTIVKNIAKRAIPYLSPDDAIIIQYLVAQLDIENPIVIQYSIKQEDLKFINLLDTHEEELVPLLKILAETHDRLAMNIAHTQLKLRDCAKNNYLVKARKTKSFCENFYRQTIELVKLRKELEKRCKSKELLSLKEKYLEIQGRL